MTTTSSRFFDELAKLMSNAAGAAQGVRREIDVLVKAQVERVLGDLQVVQREEFDAVREMAARAREENEQLKARIAGLEARLGPSDPER
jgi:BMFP domain-containing protein YqiC